MLRAVRAFLFAIAFAAMCTAQSVDESKVIAGAERAFDKASKINAAPAPGCAVGISLNGKPAFEKAFGLADMEYNIPNTPQTIFESGSVAKQFTAAAVVLLAQDGKLSLDDPVRKYIPELPDYGVPLTIRHLLNHTAGLRDWGSVMALTGNGRGDRVVTQELALDVISHQKALNFKPGDEFSYSNSGYNLAAIIVERVSKQSFNDFMTERIFKPLGMANSSIRYDYRRIIPGRAQGYSRDGSGPWHLDMPFMNVYGNGGMLTTVGDWLKWNAMLDARTWNPKLVDELETQGILNDKRKSSYALGLFHGTYHGMKEIWHDGGTAGYQTFLARYPEKGLSIAALCNGAPPVASDLAYSILDEIFGPWPKADIEAGIQLSEDQLKKYVSVYRNEKTHYSNRITLDNGVLKFENVPMRATAENTFMVGQTKVVFKLDKDGRVIGMEAFNPIGQAVPFVPESAWTPTPDELQAFAGDWYSPEAEARFALVAEGDKIFFVQRPATKFPLKPLYRDHLTGLGTVFWFDRDKSGKVVAIHAGVGTRLRDIAFERVK